MSRYCIFLLGYFYISLLHAQYFVKDDNVSDQFRVGWKKGFRLTDPVDNSYYLVLGETKGLLYYYSSPEAEPRTIKITEEKKRYVGIGFSKLFNGIFYHTYNESNYTCIVAIDVKTGEIIYRKKKIYKLDRRFDYRMLIEEVSPDNEYILVRWQNTTHPDKECVFYVVDREGNIQFTKNITDFTKDKEEQKGFVSELDKEGNWYVHVPGKIQVFDRSGVLKEEVKTAQNEFINFYWNPHTSEIVFWKMRIEGKRSGFYSSTDMDEITGNDGTFYPLRLLPMPKFNRSSVGYSLKTQFDDVTGNMLLMVEMEVVDERFLYGFKYATDVYLFSGKNKVISSFQVGAGRLKTYFYKDRLIITYQAAYRHCQTNKSQVKEIKGAGRRTYLNVIVVDPSVGKPECVDLSEFYPEKRNGLWHFWNNHYKNKPGFYTLEFN